jgi:sugar/nucleoside kinase (ribokinase family)
MAATTIRDWTEAKSIRPNVFSMDNPWWTPGRPALELVDMLRTIDCLLPSEADVASFFGAPVSAAHLLELAAHGPKIVAIKLGSHGSVVYEANTGRYTYVPALRVGVRDATGAGDSYCGAFATTLADSGDPLQAAVAGTVAASLVVESFGALTALATQESELARRTRLVREQVTSSRLDPATSLAALGAQS